MKIIIIEDDIFQSFNLENSLRILGYEDVLVANNAADLIRLLKTNKFDLAFCDIRMPDIDGITLLSLHLLEQIPSVIIVSAAEDEILKLTLGMCNQLGYDHVDVMSKPYTQEQLTNSLNRHELHVTRELVKVEEVKDTLADTDVTEALSEDKFACFYQPQFSFNDHELVGIECLSRMIKNGLEIISPIDFIPIVERLGLMAEFYSKTLRQAMMDVASIGREIRLSVNITQELLNDNLYDLTHSICTETSFPPKMLTLELTETQAYDLTPRALSNLAKLRLLGVEFAIDDFGTGYASLEQLVDLPISELKVDRMFISGCVSEYKKRQLTILSVRLAQSLGMHCVAEGVEDADTWSFLKGLGVDTCQGYYTGAPMMLGDLIPLVTQKVEKGSIKDLKEPISIRALIIADPVKTRCKALGKVVSKLLPNATIKCVETFEELSKYSNCKRETYNIIDEEFLSHLEKEQHLNFKSIIDRSRTLVISESESNRLAMEVGEVVQRQDSILDMGRVVAKTIETTNHNNEKMLEAKLSQREYAVANLLLSGFTNKHIAYELGISQKTVSSFKMRIMTKLGVKTVLELMKYIDNPKS